MQDIVGTPFQTIASTFDNIQRAWRIILACDTSFCQDSIPNFWIVLSILKLHFVAYPPVI